MSAVVRTAAGRIEGTPGRRCGVTVFRGIPYAAPPVGRLRWRDPQPAESWEGVRTSAAFGPVSPQHETAALRAFGLPMDEDCLYLNVWTGAPGSAERRPVLVWIYGGGFHEGTAADPAFDGEALAERGVVVVNFNYRLGALGFLATPELSRESPDGVSGNYGLLDCVRALQWVQENIAGFGGDPGRVTIAGQSAGAGACNFLTMSPLVTGLFHRVIAQSHARYSRDTELRYLSTSYIKLDRAERAGIDFVAQRLPEGCRSPEELRELDWRRLVEEAPRADLEVDTGSRAKPPLFRPVVDGWVLPAGYDETYRVGAPNDVDYIAGNNLDEAGAVAEQAIGEQRRRAASGFWRPGMPPTHVTLDDYLTSARAKFGALAEEFLSLYPAADDDEAARASNDAARDNSRISTYLWGSDWTRHSTKAVYTYFWTHRSPGQGEPRRAFHGSEIPYVFGNVRAGEGAWTVADEDLSGMMSAYWVNFLTSGDPNGSSLPAWERYSPGSATVLDLGPAPRRIDVSTPEKLQFWRKFFDTQTAW